MGYSQLFSAMAVSFMLATTPAVNAQEEEGQGTFTRQDAFQDWMLQCVAPEGNEVCQLTQGVVKSDTKQRLARFQIRHLPGGADVMIMTVPLGVDLRKGAGIQVTEDQFINNLTYTMCLKDGCRLQFTLTEDVVSVMRAAGGGQLVIGRPNQEDNIGLPISFAGFSAAYDAFVATQ